VVSAFFYALHAFHLKHNSFFSPNVHTLANSLKIMDYLVAYISLSYASREAGLDHVALDPHLYFEMIILPSCDLICMIHCLQVCTACSILVCECN
jgi:hypothetical protein